MRKILGMMALIVATMMATGCSKDNDDVSGGGNEAPSSFGVHKIEVSLEGNYTSYTPSMVFNAFKKGGAYANIYDENGKVYNPIYDAEYTGKKIIAKTEKECIEFACSIFLINVSGEPGKVTVKCTGYVDDKKTLSDTRTIEFKKGDTSKATHFNSVNGFTDLEQK